MRLFTALISSAVAVLSASAVSLPQASSSGVSLEQRQDGAAGYLAITFLGNQEQIFGHVAKAGSESTFTDLNGGKPILVPTQGTKGVRDPYLVSGPNKDRFWIIGTDLNIGAINNDWNRSQRNGSLSIHVWESTDLVNWSSDRLVQVMPNSFNAGMVWAPSAMWDASANSYAVFWASKTYASSDTQRTGASSNTKIYYSRTSDFSSFSTPQVWVAPSYPVIDQEILPLGGSKYVRFIKNEEVNKVYSERSDNGLFGTWTRIDPNNFVIDAVREGPATFKDINKPSRTWLWLDNYSGSGSYEAYFNDDITKNSWTLAQPTLKPTGMRHGAVIQVSQAQLSALHSKWG
ncbi:glycoside hydrolase family 43 protein [Tilletiaria anomala UBC 951]|uniref:Glycoside hydrolase family 43 protein n=1 Tax=Tilletiaria anomala (strain ATCC 24038 / CBS 436.72 / UBC 951) TaxID=1037660 RepID=A0A066W353_TILAU|nr:glycoside hydrolase family 43 protein [Tilletiaria anomala UBC 951]KDN46973.1 glycoside hydrolase family 43 protein [Tilletiaria anomala UBC 951]